jgi:hypothetical protein
VVAVNRRHSLEGYRLGWRSCYLSATRWEANSIPVTLYLARSFSHSRHAERQASWQSLAFLASSGSNQFSRRGFAATLADMRFETLRRDEVQAPRTW